MRLSGLQKLTLLDYPGKAAATVFTPGCNLRCPFCQNAALVEGEPDPDGGHAFPQIPESDLFDLLEKRHGLLDGVCITGGEPLLQPGLADFCRRIHAAGFSVKLDTNGTFPDRLQALIEAGLVDYVAMDVKNTPERYAETVGCPAFDLAPIRASMELLRGSTVPFEFRTTVVRGLHTANDLLDLARLIGPEAPWFLQSFRASEGVLAGPDAFEAWPDRDLKALLPRLRKAALHAQLRGID